MWAARKERISTSPSKQVFFRRVFSVSNSKSTTRIWCQIFALLTPHVSELPNHAYDVRFLNADAVIEWAAFALCPLRGSNGLGGLPQQRNIRWPRQRGAATGRLLSIACKIWRTVNGQKRSFAYWLNLLIWTIKPIHLAHGHNRVQCVDFKNVLNAIHQPDQADFSSGPRRGWGRCSFKTDSW